MRRTRWIVLLALWSAPASADSTATWEIIASGQSISSRGVSARSGVPPVYPSKLNGLLKRTTCRVWLRLEQNKGVEVHHEDCPDPIRPAMNDSLLTSEWQKTGTTTLDGWLPLKVSHSASPSGLRAIFRPVELYQVAKRTVPPTLSGTPQRCEATVNVSEKGKATDIQVAGCSDERSAAIETMLLKWRWTPLTVLGDARPFQTRVIITL